jgi:hypothetical protein
MKICRRVGAGHRPHLLRPEAESTSGSSFRGTIPELVSIAGVSQAHPGRAEAFSAFQKAVTDQGLSLDEYISILEVAQNDPEVGDKIRQRLPTSPN